MFHCFPNVISIKTSLNISPWMRMGFPEVFKELTLWANSFYKSESPYVCLCVCVFVCPSHFLTPFNGIFAPTSRIPMSKLFRFLGSLGKNNGKKWSQIWKLLFIKGVISPRQKKFFTDLESLGKSNGKMGFQIWKLLFIKGVKLQRWKKFFPSNFIGTSSLRKPTSR